MTISSLPRFYFGKKRIKQVDLPHKYRQIFSSLCSTSTSFIETIDQDSEIYPTHVQRSDRLHQSWIFSTEVLKQRLWPIYSLPVSNNLIHSFSESLGEGQLQWNLFNGLILHEAMVIPQDLNFQK